MEWKMEEVPISKIRILENIRTRIQPDDLSELMISMKQHGLLQPIGLYKEGSEYILSFGHRRLEAAKRLDWKYITAVVSTTLLTEEDFLTYNTIENIQRKNIQPIELGRIVRWFIEKGFTLSEIVGRLGVTKSTVVSAYRAYIQLPIKWRSTIGYIPAGKGSDKRGKIPISVLNTVLGFNLNKQELEEMLNIVKQEELTREELLVIGGLLRNKMPFKEALDNRKYFIIYSPKLCLNKEIFEREFKNHRLTKFNYIKKILVAELPGVKGLVYV